MKIEKISENQIRCTLYKADLIEKELLLDDLVYGEDKAKLLFRDLMQQASEELDFEADNTPLMIEAIPVPSQECLILIITKVNRPEEMDAKFSRFTRAIEAVCDERDERDDYDMDDDDVFEDDDDDDDEINLDGLFIDGKRVHDLADVSDESIRRLQSVVDDLNKYNPPGEEAHRARLEHLIERIRRRKAKLDGHVNEQAGGELKGDGPHAEKRGIDLYQLYVFDNISQLILAGKLVRDIYDGVNSLHKSAADNRYYLNLSNEGVETDAFIRTCDLIGEIGSRLGEAYLVPEHIDEHFKLIISKNALQTLGKLS